MKRFAFDFKNRPTMGILGFGSFGRFLTPYLMPYFNITVYDREPAAKKAAENMHIYHGTLQEAINCQIIVIAVPVQYLESLLTEIYQDINPQALVLDVSSVKVEPLRMMSRYLPSGNSIIGTHPLFGPQSGKKGIDGLSIVLCPVHTKDINKLKYFLSKFLDLKLLIRTPEVHDEQMAYVQALTHFIGRAINQMDIPGLELETPAYHYLIDIKKNLGQDSYDLFLTIENWNPYAKKIREHFIQELTKLNKALDN